MKLADYVIEYLRDAGVKKVFLIYGAANGDLVDAFSRTEGIDYICPFHEQAGAFMAEGYAKISGKMGCMIVTSGPGGQNLVTGIANCFYDSVPCLFITGQINSKFIKKNDLVRQVGFQETDIVGIVKPITKFAEQVTNPNQIKRVLDEAVYEALLGRKGPVLIDLPIDIQKMEVEPDKLKGFRYSSRLNDIKKYIKSFIKDLKEAKRPLLLVGGGARNSGVEKIPIPAVVTWNAIDIIYSDMSQYRGRIGTYGSREGNFAIQNCDLLLAIGCRFSGRITGGNLESFARGAKIYNVDIDEANCDPELQQIKCDVNIQCDAKEFIDLLLKEKIKIPEDWSIKTYEWKERYSLHPISKKKINPYNFIQKLSDYCSRDDIIVVDCGGNVVVTYQAFETKMRQRVISSHGNSPMGFSFAGALGACFAEPDKKVICIIGDGGFNMNIQELQTIKNYNIKNLKVFIMNNHIYGITRQFQNTNFGGRWLASGPDGYNPPNFVNIAESYGVHSIAIIGNDEMEGWIKFALDSPNSIIVDVNCDEFCTYEPRVVGWNTPIEDLYPYLPRNEFRENMIVEPLEGWENCVY